MREAGLLGRVATMIPAMAGRAGALDAESGFPLADMEALRDAGALRHPRRSPSALETMELLRLLGRGNLSVGRLVEAHINALKLVLTYGDDDAVAGCCAEAAAGHLFALWVTGENLRMADGVLHGGKDICSGAGFATRALVTVDVGAGAPVMMVVNVEGARVAGAYVRLHGMRSACNAAMDMDGVPAGVPIGRPGDYLRQPVFSAGAWRTTAVTLGGIESLVDAVTGALVARGRDTDAHQLARIGRMKMALHSAYLWLRQVAPIAEDPQAETGSVVAFVNLARVAVEHAGLDVIRLAQQCLGLAGLVEGQPAERIMRDLATYLRQPAPDETLCEAARYFTHHALPVM